ncbi:hypothetical protein [Agaribacter flavus]|uniref:DUF4340 domain-containing protein n=1 Tax=Agaribacter flavus TaxID=1902781 RepID=A0ABV7FV86_9ALTE
MRRLSQKAWNNVLIFSMLILIAVLNWDKFFGEGELAVMPVLPEGAVVLSIQIDQIRFERVGTGWRVVANAADLTDSLSSEHVGEIVSAWENALMRLPFEQLNAEDFYPSDHIVSVWVAGQKNGLVFSIKTIQEYTYIVHESKYYVLDFPTVAQLLP